MLSEEIKMQIGRIGTVEDCREAIRLVKYRFCILLGKEAADFYVGKEVWFMHKGSRLTGVIKKINSKSISVMVGTLRWNVSPTLLHY